MIAPLLFLLQQGPEAHYGGGAPSSTVAGASTDPVAQLFRFLLSTVPQWVQIAGILIGGPVALIVAWQAWKHRRNIVTWFQTRSRGYKLMIVGAGGFTVLIGGFVGLYNYNYVMHKNDFCQSCHIMDTAWNRFQVTAHKDLQCHACHRQPLWVSSKELFWWVLERRMAIPAHDKVPTAICTECHVRSNTDSSRTNVLLTAGHVLHLKSDSSALKNVQCTSCHGRDFHMFRPNNATCAQSGCHENAKVKLGTMTNASFLHCTTCHEFRKRVQLGANEADVKKAISPGALGCAACHQMSDQILKWNIAADPHNGSCGSCHNPHKQDQPKDAFKTCATCHTKADTLTAFHRGLGAHKLDDCGACHQAHSWKVKGTDCLACHKTIYDNKSAAPRKLGTTKPATIRHLGGGPPDSATAFEPEPFARPLASPPAQAQQPQQAGTTDSTFLHSRHKGITCTDCHATSSAHGAVKVTAPRDCLACHHGAKQKAACTSCHTASSLGPRTRAVTFTVSARPAPVTRSVPFAHTRHAKLECVKCHAADDKRTPTATCNSCHVDHHDAARDCAACHTTAKTGHDRTAHDGCASCHSTTRYAPDVGVSSRNMCLACHQPQKNHYPAGQCATCHAIPEHGPSGAGRQR